MKTITYTARGDLAEMGARSLAIQDGHIDEPIQKRWVADTCHLTYRRKSRIAVLLKLRAAKVKAWAEGIGHRLACDQRGAMLRELRQ
jgi:hypothetical protein